MTTGIAKRENGKTSMPESSFSGLVDRIFQNNLSRFFEDGFRTSPEGLYGSIPVNLRESENAYELQLVAPGLKKQDFRISLDGDLITIGFESKEEVSDKDQRWLRKEYRAQSFSRSFHLDDSIDVNKVSAEYADGILGVTLPKKEGARKISRKIEIR